MPNDALKIKSLLYKIFMEFVKYLFLVTVQGKPIRLRIFEQRSEILIYIHRSLRILRKKYGREYHYSLPLRFPSHA